MERGRPSLATELAAPHIPLPGTPFCRSLYSVRFARRCRHRRPLTCKSKLTPRERHDQSREDLLLCSSRTITVTSGLEGRLPTQGESVVKGPGNGIESYGVQLKERDKPPTDVDYLSELIAMQQNGPKDIGFFGTRNMGFLHQSLIEVLSYAMVLTDNHIFTSGATGTNAAVIRGALRAEKPHLLTVVLPQSLSKQPPESRELLQQVAEVREMPENDDLSLYEASRLCNQDIVSQVQQVICFAFHDSNLLLQTCHEAKLHRKIVTLFYLD